MSSLATVPVRAGARGVEASSTLLMLGLAVILAAAFISVPWELIAKNGFPDRDNYLDAINAARIGGAGLFDLSDESVPSLLLHEFLWRQMMVLIGMTFDDALTGFMVLSFLTTVLLTYHVIRGAGALYALIFLLCPLTIDLLVSQTRSALALGIFLSALSTRRTIVRNLLFVAAFLVHTVGAAFVLIYLFDKTLLRWSWLGARGKFFLSLCTALFASAVWAFLAQQIFAAIGDRRANIEALLPASIAFALWWCVVVVLLALFARLRSRPGDAHLVLLAFILLATFDFSTIFGAGALRFLSLSLPVVLIAVRTIRSPAVRLTALGGSMLFSVIHFFFFWSA